MSIATLITHGLDTSDASVAYLVLHGLGAFGSAPPVTTTGGHFLPTKKQYSQYKQRIIVQQRALEVREQQRLAQLRDIRRLIEEAINSPVPIENIAVKEPVSTRKNKALTAYDPALHGRLAFVEHELLEIGRQMAALQAEYRRQKDEDDIQVILELMNSGLGTLQ